ERGYGSALMGGIVAARGKSVIIGDPDGSYDFASVGPLLDKLRDGYDLVVGNRFEGGIQPGAMPPLNRFVGNPILSALGRLFYGSHVRDFHCGLRGFRKSAIERLDLQTSGMEFASEMIVKATLLGMRVGEVPTTLAPDGRSRPPHLRPWRDGWRHLRLEGGLVFGGICIAGGLGLSIAAVSDWHARHFGSLNPTATFRLIIPASLLLNLGFEIVLASFLIAVLLLPRRSE